MLAPLPEREDADGDAQAPLRLTGRGGPFQRSTEVVVLARQTRQPAGVLTRSQRLCSLFGEHDVVGRVRLPRILLLPAGGEVLRRVVAHDTQHGESWLAFVFALAHQQ